MDVAHVRLLIRIPKMKLPATVRGDEGTERRAQSPSTQAQEHGRRAVSERAQEGEEEAC